MKYFILAAIAFIAVAFNFSDVSAITGRDIQNGTITGVDILNGSLGGADIKDGSITGRDIRNESIGGADIVNGSIGSADIADGRIKEVDLSSGLTLKINGNSNGLASLTVTVAQNTSDISILQSNQTTLLSDVSTNATDISALSSTVSTNTSNISTLQSAVSTNTSNISNNEEDITDLYSKANNIWVYDNNNTRLGILIRPWYHDIDPQHFSGATLFDVENNRMFGVGVDGTIAAGGDLWFETTDCTGTPLLPITSGALPSSLSPYYLIRGPYDNFYIVPDNPTVESVNIIKRQSYDDPTSCTDYGWDQGIYLETVTSSLNDSAAMPLRYSFE